MAGFERVLQSYDVRDQLDDLASSDPLAYLRRCFAEGISAPELSVPRIQQLCVCGMVLDAILDDRDYDALEPELIADWRAHFGSACAALRGNAVASLRRALDGLRTSDPDAAAELAVLVERLAPA
jgi:hypothetical protein